MSRVFLILLLLYCCKLRAQIVTFTYDAKGNRLTKEISNGIARPSINGDTVACYNSMVTYTAHGGATYLWSTGQTDSSISVHADSNLNLKVYAFSSSGCADSATIYLHVKPLPVIGAITGDSIVCVGALLSLSDSVAGGTWYSGNSNAAISAGVVTGLAAGGSIISYSVTNNGCTSVATKNITVNPLPFAGSISGGATMCAGSTTSLSDAITGGIWSSSNLLVATVSAAGVVSGVGAGNALISYTVTNSCGAIPAIRVVTVNPLPGPITGVAHVCAGSSTTLGNSIAGGSWSSSNLVVATISSTGLVSGILPGIDTIYYTLPSGCVSSLIFTVNVMPAAIAGIVPLCTGSTLSLTDAITGGSWSSSNSSVVSISSAGSCNAVSSGTATVTYTLGTGCQVTGFVSVNPQPAAIGGQSSVCEGSTITLTNATTGGSWISSNTSIATISNSGGLKGINMGRDTIQYRLPSGCATSTVVTVNVLPGSITGPSAVCAGASVSLNDTTAGGTWICSNITLATISNTGSVTGITAGSPVITYALPTGCLKTTTINVNPLPSAITGSSNVCIGSSIVLSESTTSGTWTSSNLSIATVSISGIVRGVTSGVDTITYRLATGCSTNAIINVNPIPANITGSNTVCVGSSVSLNDTSTGGTWSSSNIAIATISSTGIVTGVTSGTATITYSLPSGCYATRPLTVNPPPSVITGPSAVCVGATISLYSGSTGGTWQSLSTSVASISSGGIVRGLSPGTDSISYRLSTGCTIYTVVSVNPLPTAISGPRAVCPGNSVSLNDTTIGGIWSSNNITIATVSSSGNVTGITAGTTTISYIMPTGCFASIPMTVNPLPAAISGSSTVCSGVLISLTNTTTGGTWVSSNLSIATISTSGILRGVIAGIDTITYRLPTGCSVTAVVTVNTTPSAITGLSAVCTGTSITLADTSGVGTWSSSSPSIAIVGSEGVVSGISPGTATITYALSPCFVTKLVSVNPLPGAITGTAVVCEGNTTTLASTSSGGAWSSSNNVVATISASGLARGVSAGLDTITYRSASGCIVTTSFLVNPNPSPILGGQPLCVGASISLTDTTIAGTWSSGNTAIATISSSGRLTGITPGSATVTYQLSSGCSARTGIIINPLPSGIIGGTAVCAGQTMALTNPTSGGVWLSTTPAIATVSNMGLVQAIAQGADTIVYRLSTGCQASTLIEVNDVPGPITGPASVCVGQYINMNNGVSGGAWSISNASIATISTTGAITGLTAGNVTVTYQLTTGCFVTSLVTVNPLPGNISGLSSLCIGASTILSTYAIGGLWSSSDPSIATVNSFGVVTPVSSGTTFINYTLPTGCSASVSISVNPIPSAISGLDAVCVGSTTTLSNPVTGMWSISDAGTAVISGSGAIYGVSPGTAIVTYTLASGCSAYKLITVNQIPGAITGVSALCVGRNEILNNLTAGGTWISSDTSIATASGSGLLSAIRPGSVSISYVLPTGCVSSTSVNVNANPVGITGGASVCEMNHITLSDSTAGGIWSSSNSSIATVSGSGDVLGITSGTVTISYMLANNCYVTKVMSVNELPSSITGVTNVCQDNSTILTNTSSGGAWSSSDTAIARVNSTGIVFGTTAGMASITYQLPTGCQTSIPVMVNSVPAAISGSDSVCVNSAAVLENSIAGGGWASSNVSVATISDSGILYGVSSGTVIISYVLPTGCLVSKLVRVNSIPSAISGPGSVCEHSMVSLTNSLTGGRWSTNDTLILAISPTGDVHGLSSGVAIVSYTLPNSCYTTASMEVDRTPSPIEGRDSVCENDTVQLTNLVEDGTWSTSGYFASIDSLGILTGHNAGFTTVSYQSANGCIASKIIHVNQSPSGITGTTVTCQGNSGMLYSVTPGGIWSSSDTLVASIANTGFFISSMPGNVLVSYRLYNGCATTAFINVNPTPSSILGADSVCTDDYITLFDSASDGSWSVSNNAIATIASDGALFGISSGSVVVTYSMATGCYVTKVVKVNAKPLPITGPSNVCVGLSVEFSDITTNGTWFSSNPSVATISQFGLVTGVADGNATISYFNMSGCYTSANIVAVRSSHLNTNTNAICQGASLTMPDQPYLGVWKSSNRSIASIDENGMVSAVSAGTAIISYILASGCPDTTLITVKPLPYFSNDTSGTICSGDSFTFLPLFDTQGVSLQWTRNSAYSIVPKFASGTDSIFGKLTNTALQPVNCQYICTLTSNGCSNVQTLDIQVNPRPSASITAVPGRSVCVNALNQNFGVQNSDENLSYSWTAINADIVAAQKGKCLVDFKAVGTAAIILEENVTGYQCYSSDTFSLKVNEASMPAVVVEYEHPTFIATPKIGMDSYQWGYDDVQTLDSTAIDGAINSRFVNATPDFDSKRYWVITTKDGCMQKVYCSRLITTMEVMPNPSMGFVKVFFTGDTLTDCHIEVTDMIGQKMAKYPVIDNAAIVDLSAFSSGTYLISAYEKSSRIGVKRVVKQ